ncbi:MAG: hypothetical protein V7L14_17850 [Nostoc sp.]|uniref:hypothetical protein n=1 Tax=Nostoc sp. TaxID=1180 RepID=UPI002FFC765B
MICSDHSCHQLLNIPAMPAANATPGWCAEARNALFWLQAGYAVNLEWNSYCL